MPNDAFLTRLQRKIATDISQIAPYDELERKTIDDAVQWARSGVNIFRIAKPDKPPQHLVSYFVIVDPAQRSILLCDHIKAQLWLPTGGHVELGEDPAQTVLREVQEEVGRPGVFLHDNDRPFFITATKTVGLTPGHTDVSLWYLLRGSVQEFIDYDRREFNDVQWFTFDEVLEADPVIFDPHLQRFTRKLQHFLSLH